MTPELATKIDEMVKLVIEQSQPTAVSFNLFIDIEGSSITWKETSPEYLKLSGFTMRNLKGEWIK